MFRPCASTAAAAAASLALLAPLGVAAEEPAVRDPLEPYRVAAGADGAAQSAPRYVVTGVVVRGSQRVAIVNGRLLRVGDSVDGASIARIEPDTVHLRREGREIVVALGNAGSRAAKEPTVDD